ncbi:hypothetical protein KJ865_03985 [Myxococcota bacterium]|nr:hypothetical protein [Myxococcota bacterium]
MKGSAMGAEPTMLQLCCYSVGINIHQRIGEIHHRSCLLRSQLSLIIQGGKPPDGHLALYIGLLHNHSEIVLSTAPTQEEGKHHPGVNSRLLGQLKVHYQFPLLD